MYNAAARSRPCGLVFASRGNRTELCGAQGFAARFREGLIGMLRYVVKRVLLAILTVFIIAAITFFAMNAIPGGAVCQ